MKIDLMPPYSAIYRLGYVVVDRTGRKQVLLVNSSKDRTTTSYARYLFCCSIGAMLPEDIEIDHIDNDKTNDDLSNLQAITKKENIKKQIVASNKKRVVKHGSLNAYRKCKCIKCKLGKSLYSKGLIDKYKELIEH